MATTLTLSACAVDRGVTERLPVTVRGDGRPDFVRTITRRDTSSAAIACDVIEGSDRSDGLLLSVALGAGYQPLCVVVTSEEGVDVLTIDVRAARGLEPTLLLVSVDAATRQLAVVWRDQAEGLERTLRTWLAP